MANDQTCTLARSTVPLKYNHTGEQVLVVNYIHGDNGAASLTVDVATTFLVAKIPAWGVVTDMFGTVAPGPNAGGTYSYRLHTDTLITAKSITVSVSRILVNTALGVTATSSASATDFRYIKAIVTPGTTTSSLVISAVIRYTSDSPDSGESPGRAGSG